jgi:hypothetical protein
MCTYEDIKKSKGTLTPLSKGNSVEINYCELDDESAKKLLITLQKGKISPENQDLFIKEISIKNDGVDQFSKGQSDLVKTEKGYILTANSHRNSARFKADIDTPMVTKDAFICHIQIENIDFDLRESKKVTLRDSTVYENVKATIYPYGVSYDIGADENDEEI